MIDKSSLLLLLFSSQIYMYNKPRSLVQILLVYKIFADTTSLLNLITFSSPFSKMHSNKLMAFPSTLDMLDQILNIIFATF